MGNDYCFDCVIIGGGLAGIYTALNVSSELKIGMFIKDKIEKGSSNLAQGGIAAEVNFDPAKIQEHYEDTLRAGSYINNEEATKILVNEAKDNILSLIDLGVNFDKTEDGSLVKTLEGGHRSRRILHAGGDATGACVMKDLRTTLSQRSNITIFEDELVFEIIQQNDKAVGVIAINQKNEPVYVFSNQIVIASGGIGGIYKNSTNEKLACGDGIALAYRAGVTIKGMEFVQFHPTGLYEEDHQGKRFLISEAVRGEGAVLRNIDGVRFMAKYDNERMELAPRDVVSQSIYREMFDTWSDHVYLDITSKSSEYLMKRFPTIYAKCASIGIDMAHDYIPVSPIEHFLCGGIATDILGHTSLDNLYAVGECAYTGVHGANRLASNSLLECLVFGRRIACEINKQPVTKLKNYLQFYQDIPTDFYKYNFKAIRVEIREIMDKYVSIVRTDEGLAIAKSIIQKHYDNLLKLEVMSFYYYETLNMATCALLVINQAIMRPESLGCHYRVKSDLDLTIIDKIIKDALYEDMPNGDITTDNLVDDNHQSVGYFIAKEDGIISGLEVLKRVFKLVGGSVIIENYFLDGDHIHNKDVIAKITGNTKSILKGERVALNIFQRMCGIATITNSYVKELVGSTKLLDTRKTTPNLRYLEKLAVKQGGGTNHRFSLSDMAMIKDNHIEACGSITLAVMRVKAKTKAKVEVEVETEKQFLEALATPCDIIMLDNMTNEQMIWCVKKNQGLKKLEASGNMTKERIKEVALTGVDFISVGALTHSPKALDISLKFHKL